MQRESAARWELTPLELELLHYEHEGKPTAGGRSRALTRRAFRNDLPSVIVDRHSKGGLEEHLLDMLRNNLAFATSMMLEGQLVARGLVDRAKLEVALSNRPSTLAAYTNEIHIYVAIEAWLRRMNSV